MFENDILDNIINELQKIEKNLEKTLEITGTTKRVNSMKKEIKELSWNGIYSKYHPEVNIDDPARNELFDMYKYVYELMKQNGEID
jgi:adenosine deaminase